MDLLPAAYVERRRARRNTALVIAVGGVIVLLLILWFFMLQGQINTARNDLAAVKQQNALLESQIADLQVFAALDAEVQAKRTALQNVFAGDIDWPSVMTEIAMVTPGDIWLSGLQMAGTGAVPVEGAEGSTGTLSFGANSSTCMPGVARWLVRVASVDEFDAAWIGSATEADSRPGCEPPVVFDSTVELNERALSHRFEGDLE